MLPRTMGVGGRLWLSLWVCCGLVFCGLPQLEALEEGDSCTLKGDIAGVCRVSSECEPHIDKYIKSGRLTINDVPTCGLGPREEIVCCPVAACCPDETRPRQVPTTTTTTTTTTTKRPATKVSIGLDEDSTYFDFQRLLNQKKPKTASNNNNNVRQPTPLPAFRSVDQFQSVGPLGPAVDVERQPKIINRPQSFSWPQDRRPSAMRMPTGQSANLIQQVNDRLRQQGMDIMPSREVNTFAQPPVFTPPTTTTTTTARPIADFNLDPWAPFRFRPSPQDELESNDLGNGDAELFGPETTTTRTIQATPTTRVDTNQGSERASVRACRQIEDRQSLNQLTPHILDGIPVDDGIYPHMAAIAFSVIGNIVYRCGGSLISRRHVLTAAHCVNSESDTPVHVRLGTVNIEQVNKHYQDIPLTNNIIVHPDYVGSSKYNDIAILELAEEAKLSYYIYPACLETNPVDPPAASKLFVAGWGVMNQTNRRTSKILLRAPLNIVPLEQCNVSFAEQPNSKRFLANGVTNTLLCAADEVRQKADACQGDSGGPLVLERDIVNTKYSILGVISSGFGCATKTPGLYTRVAAYLDFIESIVWPNNVV